LSLLSLLQKEVSLLKLSRKKNVSLCKNAKTAKLTQGGFFTELNS